MPHIDLGFENLKLLHKIGSLESQNRVLSSLHQGDLAEISNLTRLKEEYYNAANSWRVSSYVNMGMFLASWVWIFLKHFLY